MVHRVHRRSLLVYLPASESFYHFDSSHGRNEHAASLTAGKFWQMLGKKGQWPPGILSSDRLIG